MRIVILDSFTADQGEGPAAWPELTALGDVVLHHRTPPALVVERCRAAAAIITNKVVLDAAALAALSELRYVGVCATGTNVVDLAAARTRGVAVTNVPGYAAEAVAQHAFALILHLAVDIAGHAAAVKAGR